MTATAAQYVIPSGKHKGLTLADVHAQGIGGLPWFRWALTSPSVPVDLAEAVRAFVAEHNPALLPDVPEVRSPTVSPRAKSAVREARQKRRDEIQRRWTERRALLLFTKSYAKPSRPDDLLHGLLAFSQWVNVEALLDAVDLSNSDRTALLSRAVRVIQLKELPYDEYLQTEEWQAKAAAAKKRFGGRCALDASHPADHAHHRTYERRGREVADDLVPLCADCHAKFHNRRA